MSYKNSLIKSAITSFGLKIAQATTGLIISISLGRMLGAESFGTYAAILALFQLVIAPLTTGVVPLLVRQVSALSASKSWIALKGFILWAAILSVSYLSVTIALIGTNSTISNKFHDLKGTEVCAGLTAIFLLSAFSGYHRGLKNTVFGQSGELFRNILLSAAVLSFVVLGLDISTGTAVRAFLGCTAIAAFILMIGATKHSPIELIQSKEISVMNASWLRMTGTFILIYGSIKVADLMGVLLTRSLSSAQEAGLFQASYQISALILFGLGAITVTIIPHFTSLKQTGDNSKLRKLAQKSSQAASAFAALCAIGILLFGEDLIHALYGSEFLQAQPILIIMSIAYLIQASTGPSLQLLIATGYDRELIPVVLTGIVASMLTAALTVPTLGGFGAALGMMVWIVIVNISCWRLCRTQLHIDTFFLAPFYQQDTN